MRILLVCAGGFSTSLLAERVKESLDSKDDYIEARPISDVKNNIEEFDIVLVAPQAKYKFDDIKRIANAHGKKVGLIDGKLMSTMDGKKIIEQIKKIMEE